jgi:MFS family permease
MLNIINPASYVAVAGVAVLLFSSLGAVSFGSLVDRYGRKPFLIISPVISGVATALIPFLDNFTSFVIAGSFIGLGFGIFFSVSKAMASDLAPRNNEGKYMAYYNISVSESSAIASLIYGLILATFVSSRQGFMVVFEMSALFYLFSFVLLMEFNRKNDMEIWKSRNVLGRPP